MKTLKRLYEKVVRVFKDVREELTGYPADDSLLPTYELAMKIAGRPPSKVERLFDGAVALSYDGDREFYMFSCIPSRGNPSKNNLWFVDSFDGDYLFGVDINFSAYHRRKWMVWNEIGSPPYDVSFEEAVRYCARAASIKTHPDRSIAEEIFIPLVDIGKRIWKYGF
jgi:hypothetical protein